MSDSVRPHRQQPTRLPRPWDAPGKNIGVGCYFLLQCMKVKSESEVPQSCLTLVTPRTVAYQAPLSMGFSRQEYWSGVPLPSPLYRLEMAYFLKISHSQIILDSRFTFKEQAGERATKDLVYNLMPLSVIRGALCCLNANVILHQQ